jgi:hypothetical protein
VTGESVKKALMKSEDCKADLALLRDLKDHDELSEDESDAFGDMYERLENGTFPTMTIPQRKWARDVADRVGIAYARLASEKAENVPRGREIVLGGVLSKDALQAALMARKR